MVNTRLALTGQIHIKEKETMRNQVTLLIDADILAYNVASANQKTYRFGDGVDGLAVHTGTLKEATDLADRRLGAWVRLLKATDLIICLSCKTADGFRKAILPSYKENRSGVARPVQLQDVKDYLAKSFVSRLMPKLEADDVMGMLSTEKHNGKRIIVSEDKDMETINGWLFNPRHDTKARYISKEHAHRFHMNQVLMGDAVDGYKGCRGIGKVKAARLLDSCDPVDWWSMIVGMYEAVGLTEADALVQARMARILRDEDYDYKNHLPILWSPDV